MDDSDERRRDSNEVAIPKWMPTFADMMTLLMCFFVLLLTFAEMDIRRYQQIAGSMASAFGVQRKVEAERVPMGTSIIAQEFSPGVPRPTPISEIYQQTDSLPEMTLSTESSEREESEPLDPVEPEPVEPQQPAEPQQPVQPVELTEQMKINIQALIEQTQNDAIAMANQLQSEIIKGEVEIETQGRKIVLRIREKGSFSSGSADLKPEYRQLMRQVRDMLATRPGALMVQGHTDDIPIATSRFRSNWELSSSRAVSVAEELLADSVLDPKRFSVTGFAETRPLAANDSDEGRARNRRVEIVINQGLDKESREQLEALKTEDPAYYESLGIDEQFNIRPDEVF
jgi:chemotaxis protein MotB